MRDWVRTHGWFLAVLAIAAFTMLFRLGDRPIENWDEGIHGAVSIDMVERGDWVTPWYAGGPYFRKPPLKLWMSAALFDAFGISAWTLRLPNAIAGILTSLLVAWWMWEWRRSRIEAFLAGVIVATMRPIFFHAFRTGEMDGLLTFFVTAALYCWWKAVANAERRIPNQSKFGSEWTQNAEQKREILRSSFIVHRFAFWPILVGLAIGLAVMTKSAAGLLPLPIIAADYLLHRRWRTIPIRFLLLTSYFLLLVVLPWHLAMTARHGATFWNDYFGWHVVKRTTEAIHNATAGTWWYLPTLVRKFSPYAWWFLPAIAHAIAWGKKTDGQKNRWATPPIASSAPCRAVSLPDRTTTLLLLWFIVTLALFTVAKTKFDWYLLPLYPAAAMLVATFLAAARDVARSRTTAALHLAALAIAVLALPSLYPDGSILNRFLARAYAPFWHPIVAAALAVVVTVGAVHFLRRRGWDADRIGSSVMAIVVIIVLVPSLAVTTRHLVRTEPPGPFPAIAAAVRGTGGHLVSYGMDYKQHPAGYFILRGALSGDVRVLDGRRRDVARTIAMLRERERGFLLIQQGTELPEELRQEVGDPRTFGDFTLWRRL